MTDSVIGGIEEYIRQCPLLKDGVFRVDALGDQAVDIRLKPGSLILLCNDMSTGMN